jgi:lipopolysaccharide/colanic/teichoic acid biosynthesis glycosyltransferase
MFERTPKADTLSRNRSARNGGDQTATRAREQRSANHANDEAVSHLLQETVLDLWRNERNAAAKTPAESRSGEELSAARAGDVFALQTITCKKEQGDSERTTARSFELPYWKRLLDVTLILLTLPLWLPLMLLLIVAVRLSSPGPIFYRQERIGHHGRRFMIYKFRSMKVDAETHLHEKHLERLIQESVPMVKLDGAGDPRILPWGRIMRATALDELPQLFNVLRGDMSLVGPRPCTVHEFSRYAKWQQERVAAAPGLTGYWQVNGKNKTTFNEMIEMDIFYAKNLSLGLDVKILLQTIPALVDQTVESFASRRAALPRGTFSRGAKSSAEV